MPLHQLPNFHAAPSKATAMRRFTDVFGSIFMSLGRWPLANVYGIVPKSTQGRSRHNTILVLD